MRFAILALSSSHGPWSELLKAGPEKTWLSKSNLEHYAKVLARKHGYYDLLVNKVFNSRFSDKVWKPKNINLDRIKYTVIDENEIVVDLRENWTNLVLKCLKGFEYSLKNWDFDYLIRVNSTAYIDTAALMRSLKNSGFPDYAGPLISKKSFVSGWAIILSKRALEILINAKKQDMIFDDEFIGKILEQHKIYPVDLPYIEVDNEKKLSEIANSDTQDIALWRFKSLNKSNHRNDAILMNQFHQQRYMYE